MNVARFALSNKRAITFGVAFITFAGVYALTTLPSGIYPEVEFPRIAIVVHSGDLSPRIMTIAVTRPLEEAARGVLGARRVRSKTIRGAAEISVLFNPETNMQQALQLMQGKIDEARQTLPPSTAIIVERMTPSVFPILSFNVMGGLPAVDLNDIATFQLRPLLSRIPGIARIDVIASEEREVSVIVDPERLAAARLNLEQIEEALRRTNQVTTVGRMPKDHRQFQVLSVSELSSLDEIRKVVVAFRGQTPVYLGDIAEIREGIVDPRTLVSGNGEPAAIVTIARQIRGDIVAIADGVERTLSEQAHSLPPVIRIQKVYDLAGFVRESVSSVRDAIVIGGLLTVLVLMAFLRDWRATIIAATTLPLTIIGTFAILRLSNGTINLMSMGGLAIAIGLVIDDAVVVVENVHRHLGTGQTTATALELGTNELVGPVLGSTLTTVVVFLPLGLLQGVVGQFFAALSLTLSGAVLLSLAYALLFIPVPAAWLLRPRGVHEDNRWWLGTLYERFLLGTLRHAWIVIGVTSIVAVIGALMYFRLETGFLPEMDEGGYVIDYLTPSGTSLPESDAMLRRIERILGETPEVEGFTRRTGTELGLFATEQNKGDFIVRLKPRASRHRSSEAVISEQRDRFEREVPGVSIEFVQLLQDMLGDLEGNPQPVEVKLFGDDLATLSGLASRVEAKMKTITGLVDIVGPRSGNPEIELAIDSTRAAKTGLSPSQITTQVGAGLLGTVATAVRRGDRLIDLRVRFPDSFRFDSTRLKDFPLVSSAGTLVPLSAVADLTQVEGSAQLYREDLKQMMPVTGRLEGRDLGSVMEDVRRMLASEPLPVGYSYQLGGQYESQQASFRSLVVVSSLAMLLVLGVLVAQFRRFTSALVVMSAAPLSLAGAFGLLLATGTALNVSAFMGLILLIGLIVKNGIILIDYAHLLAEGGMDWREALVRAGTVRLRPILMTTLCTLFGLLPLALGIGPGAELQKPLALAVIGGLSVSTVVTLVFVPATMSLLGDGR